MKRKSEVMWNQPDWSVRLYRMANLVVKVVGCIIFAGLTWYSMRFTQYMLPNGNEVPVDTKDSIWKNLLVLAAAFLFLALLRLAEKKLRPITQYRISSAALMTAALWVGVWCFWWILSADRVPEGDQAYIYGAASYFREGNFYFFGSGGYLGMYPFQLGLVALIELLFVFAGAYNYLAFEVICGLMAVGIVILGFQVLKLLTDSMAAMVFYCALMMGCIPLICYTSWVYGDLPCIFFTLLAFYALLKYDVDHKKRWLVLLVSSVVFAVLVREHSLIYVIALLIAGILHAGKKRDLRLAVTAVLICVVPQLVFAGITQIYEVRSGVSSCEGIPYVASIAMGLQESWRGNGWYNNYPKDIYGDANLDVDATAELAKQEIRLRLEEFKASLSYTVWFFKTKLLSQWNEPLYQSVYFNTNYNNSQKPPAEGSFLESISGRNFSKVLALSDRVQFVIYAGVLLYFLLCVRKDSNLLHHILVITMIGGFLFSIIWEAKARYIFPYYVTMFPVAALGYARAAEKAEAWIGKMKKPKQKDNIIEFKRVA